MSRVRLPVGWVSEAQPTKWQGFATGGLCFADPYNNRGDTNEDGLMATKTRRVAQRPSESYLALTEEFPLRPIRSEAELNRAIAMVNALSDRGRLSRDEHDYLLVLASLIEVFEDAHQPIPTVAGVAMLRSLIEFKEVTQAQVATETGIAESTLSELLAGKRKLAAKYITALAKYFKVDSALLLPD